MKQMKRKTTILMTMFAFVVCLSACGNKMPASGSASDQARIEELEKEIEELKADREEDSVVQEETSTIQEETESSGADDSDPEIYDRIVEELDQYIADQDFENLFSGYSAYREMYPELSDKLEEKEVEYTGQMTSVFDEWIMAADELAAAGDVVNARQKLDNITVITDMEDHFEELDVYGDLYEERLSYYYDYNKYRTSVNLMNNEFDMGDGCYYRDKNWSQFNKYQDRYGGNYNEYYEFVVSQSNEQGRKPYVIFNAGENYDTFNASLTCHEGMAEDKKFHVEVYGDDTLLYTSDSFSSLDEPFTINIDITGYRLVKFVAVREDHYLSFATKQPSVAMYEASLSNADMPEFEYYISQKTDEEQ